MGKNMGILNGIKREFHFRCNRKSRLRVVDAQVFPGRIMGFAAKLAVMW